MAPLGEHARWTAGVICICVVAVLWTGATVLKQVIFQDLDYNEPLVLSYVCNACYVFHLPLFALGRCLGFVKPVRWRRSMVVVGEVEQAVSTTSSSDFSNGDAPEGFARDAVVAGLIIAPMWFAAQWTYNSGVAKTSVTSSTVISTTSVVWTLLGSVLFAGERLTWLKGLGVSCCVAGNIATQLGDSKGSSASGAVLGDILCLVSAVCYAVYTTSLKKLAAEETSVAIIFGVIGVFIIVAGLPIVLFLDNGALGRMTPKIFGLLVFNGIFDNVVAQYLWAKAVQWISPTAATVGLSLTIPLSIVADLLRKNPPSPWSYLASVLVVAGFTSVTLATRPEAGGAADGGPTSEGVAVEVASLDRSPLASGKKQLREGRERPPSALRVARDPSPIVASYLVVVSFTSVTLATRPEAGGAADDGATSEGVAVEAASMDRSPLASGKKHSPRGP
eukprot:CAMPEP_0183601962 /NCGR_PEP_ID=MMETSP0371-20130417/180706_1 /TAXON_ID=268820 /ORGANISM="Peridinium aciculiferum, Strain PAER-2" /LENGTH=447 /DNA_ID=CAMNT_0025814055 /DNA_START=16 /DNA_END=1361 /DNA_ORIENTATION=+